MSFRNADQKSVDLLPKDDIELRSLIADAATSALKQYIDIASKKTFGQAGAKNAMLVWNQLAQAETLDIQYQILHDHFKKGPGDLDDDSFKTFLLSALLNIFIPYLDPAEKEKWEKVIKNKLLVKEKRDEIRLLAITAFSSEDSKELISKVHEKISLSQSSSPSSIWGSLGEFFGKKSNPFMSFQYVLWKKIGATVLLFHKENDNLSPSTIRCGQSEGKPIHYRNTEHTSLAMEILTKDVMLSVLIRIFLDYYPFLKIAFGQTILDTIKYVEFDIKTAIDIDKAITNVSKNFTNPRNSHNLSVESLKSLASFECRTPEENNYTLRYFVETLGNLIATDKGSACYYLLGAMDNSIPDDQWEKAVSILTNTTPQFLAGGIRNIPHEYLQHRQLEGIQSMTTTVTRNNALIDALLTPLTTKERFLFPHNNSYCHALFKLFPHCEEKQATYIIESLIPRMHVAGEDIIRGFSLTENVEKIPSYILPKLIDAILKYANQKKEGYCCKSCIAAICKIALSIKDPEQSDKVIAQITGFLYSLLTRGLLYSQQKILVYDAIVILSARDRPIEISQFISILIASLNSASLEKDYKYDQRTLLQLSHLAPHEADKITMPLLVNALIDPEKLVEKKPSGKQDNDVELFENACDVFMKLIKKQPGRIDQSHMDKVIENFKHRLNNPHEHRKYILEICHIFSELDLLLIKKEHKEAIQIAIPDNIFSDNLPKRRKATQLMFLLDDAQQKVVSGYNFFSSSRLTFHLNKDLFDRAAMDFNDAKNVLICLCTTLAHSSTKDASKNAMRDTFFSLFKRIDPRLKGVIMRNLLTIYESTKNDFTDELILLASLLEKINKHLSDELFDLETNLLSQKVLPYLGQNVTSIVLSYLFTNKNIKSDSNEVKASELTHRLV